MLQLWEPPQRSGSSTGGNQSTVLLFAPQEKVGYFFIWKFLSQLVVHQGLSSDLLTILEGSFKGRLLEYNPANGKTRTLIPELTFGNGVALAPDESYVLVADQYRYRIKRYWLKGAKAGQEDIFADNLPGFVHNIYIDDKNILWAEFTTTRADFIPHDNPWIKAQLASKNCFCTSDARRPTMHKCFHNICADTTQEQLY